MSARAKRRAIDAAPFVKSRGVYIDVGSACVDVPPSPKTDYLSGSVFLFASSRLISMILNYGYG